MGKQIGLSAAQLCAFLRLDGEYSVNGLHVLNPVMCTQCSWSEVSSTFTVNGVSKKIYLGAAVDGTKLADPSK